MSQMNDMEFESPDIALSEEEIYQISSAVEKLTLEHGPKDAAEYLKGHPSHVNEFLFTSSRKVSSERQIYPCFRDSRCDVFCS